MNWLRGKYNGRAITGLELKIVIDLSSWRLWPIWLPDVGGLHWLCLRTFWQPCYR